MATQISIAVVEHDGSFLIGQRPAGISLAGLWEFPGGKLELGESPAAAAVRECYEETGLSVRVVGEYPQHCETYEHDQVELHFFQCIPLEPQKAPTIPYRWIARNKLADYEFPSGNRELLKLLLAAASEDTPQ